MYIDGVTDNIASMFFDKIVLSGVVCVDCRELLQLRQIDIVLYVDKFRNLIYRLTLHFRTVALQTS